MPARCAARARTCRTWKPSSADSGIASGRRQTTRTPYGPSSPAQSSAACYACTNAASASTANAPGNSHTTWIVTFFVPSRSTERSWLALTSSCTVVFE
jgi:hypothetical protein